MMHGARFAAVGLFGFVVQIAALWALTGPGGLHYIVATALATELAVLHNFVWHARWTWADRAATRAGYMRPLLRFHASNGLTSIAGAVAVTTALTELAGLPYLLANGVSVAACAAANFALADLVVFRARKPHGNNPRTAAAGEPAPPANRRAGLLTVSIVVWMAAGIGMNADSPTSRTRAAFDRYAQLTEEQISTHLRGGPFLSVNRLRGAERAEAEARLRHGEVIVTRTATLDAGRSIEMPGALVHHWRGVVYAEGATLERTLAVMQDYERYPEVYRPTVRRASIDARAGDDFRVSTQVFMKKIVTVVLNVDYDVRYVRLSPTRAYVRSRSTRIAEVRDAGTPAESEKPASEDSGWLWGLNNYCSLEERAGGTYIECESISLTRDIPTGFGWLVRPFVTSIPKESLEFTLRALRESVREGLPLG